MAVSTAYAPLSYAGNGSTTAFSVTWPFFDGSLVVTLVSSDGTETVKTITTHYTVSGGTDANGLPATGTVTMGTAPASGETLRIERATTNTQASTWTEGGAFSAKSLEAALDRRTLVAQEVLYDTELTWRTAWATATAYAQSDLVTHNGNVYIATSGHTSGASTEPGVGADWGDYWDLVIRGVSAGLTWEFNSSTSGDPGTGKFLLNHATLSSVTGANISDSEINSVDVSAFLATVDDSTASVRGHLLISNRTTPSAFAIYSVTGASTDNSTYWSLALTHVASNGTLADHCTLTFLRSGNDGATQGIYVQASSPATSGPDGSLWIDSDSSDYDLYQLSSGSWFDTGLNMRGPAGAGSGDMLAATYDPANVAQQLVGLTATQTLTNKTLTSPTLTSPTLNSPTINTSVALPANAVDAITEIASALKSGADPTLITGTAGTNGNLAQWNADGDLVDGPTPPTGTIVGTTDTQTLTNKTLTSPVINVGSDAQGDVYYRNGSGIFTRLAPGTSGQYLQTQGAGANPQWADGGGNWTVATEQATTSGTSIDFTGIPSGANIIVVHFYGVGFGGASSIPSIVVQIGDSGGIETTGYLSSSLASGSTLSSTSGFIINSVDRNGGASGLLIINRGSSDGTKWTSTHGLHRQAGSFAATSALSGGGQKTLSGELDRLRITSDTGNAFNAGSVNISYM